MLDHIVVQTTAGAQRCLEFLRKYNLGRANFIPLDKMKKGAHDRAVDTPEGAPRLFDVIRPGNYAVIPALYLGVGNTLVAPDLDVATRWAFDFRKRWRVVTIDGNLIESSGTMQGGGKSVRRGGMRISVSIEDSPNPKHKFTNRCKEFTNYFCLFVYLFGQKSKNNPSTSTNIAMISEVSEEECSKYEQRASEALEKLQEVRSKRRSLSNEVRQLSKRIQALNVQLPKLSMKISGCDTTREELTKRLPDLKKLCCLSETDNIKLSDLNKKVKKCESDMASCTKLASKLEGEVAKIQSAILDVGGEKLKSQKQKCEKILSKLNSKSKELSSSKVTINSSQKAATKAKAAMETAENELQEIVKKIERKIEELKKLEDSAMAVMEQYEKVKENEEIKRKNLEAVTKECEDLKRNQSKLKHVEVEIVGKMETLKKNMNDFKKRQSHWTKEIAKLNSEEEQDEEYDLSDDESENGDDEVTDTDIIDGENKSGESLDDDVEEMECDVDEGDGDKNKLPSKVRNRKSLQSKYALPVLPEGALEQYSSRELTNEIATLEKERDTIAKNANMGAIEEYRKKESDYLAR